MLCVVLRAKKQLICALAQLRNEAREKRAEMRKARRQAAASGHTDNIRIDVGRDAKVSVTKRAWMSDSLIASVVQPTLMHDDELDELLNQVRGAKKQGRKGNNLLQDEEKENSASVKNIIAIGEEIFGNSGNGSGLRSGGDDLGDRKPPRLARVRCVLTYHSSRNNTV